MIKIVEVTTKKQWKIFAKFPINLYKDNPYYVPVFVNDDVNMANPKKNKSAKNCTVKAFLAYKDDVLAGRIAGIIVHDSNDIYNQKRVRFSRFDFINDIGVAKALLDAVANFGKEHGMEEIHGPWGFNDTDREGMLTEGFDRQGSYATIYNYPYYPEFMDELGFKGESFWVEEKFKLAPDGDPLLQRYVKLKEFVKKKFELRELTETLSVKQILKDYGDKFFDCYNSAYSKLDMFVEIKDEAKQEVLDTFGAMLNRKYLSVIANKNDEVVAFGVVLPAFGHILKKHNGKMNLPFIIELFKTINHPTTLELTLVAVRPDYAKLGVTAACLGKICEVILSEGVTDVVTDPTLETNEAVRAQWSTVPTEIIKRRRTYIKDID